MTCSSEPICKADPLLSVPRESGGWVEIWIAGSLPLSCVSLSQDARPLLDGFMWPAWQTDFCWIYIAYKTNSKHLNSERGRNTSTHLNRIFRGRHPLICHILAKQLLLALSNTSDSCSGLKALENEYCFLSIFFFLFLHSVFSGCQGLLEGSIEDFPKLSLGWPWYKLQPQWPFGDHRLPMCISSSSLL